MIESLEFHINNIDLLADGVNIFTGQAHLVRVKGSESFDDQPPIWSIISDGHFAARNRSLMGCSI